MPLPPEPNPLPHGLARYRGPEFLEDLVHATADVLVAHGLQVGQAVEVAQDVAGRVARTWGGERVRVPTGTVSQTPLLWFERRRRDIEIYTAFRGNNHRELMRRYRLSSSQLDIVLRRVRLLRRENPDLVRLPRPTLAPPPPEQLPLPLDA